MENLSAFRSVPRTGVIYVMSEAQAQGYRAEDSTWANLGQGQPETGPLGSAPARVRSVDIAGYDQDYAPVAGVWELREAVAGLYNQLFRRGLPSRYSAENICISGGGRVALIRACAALSTIHLGHFLPDYTAYEELLDVFRRFTPTPILLDPKNGYDFSHADLKREIMGRGLGAILLSNPCNPTGKVVSGESLKSWIDTARALHCTLLFDEAYSHYVWKPGASEINSAAEFVEDIESDPVVLFDGLTKNWRYPGWRLFWTVGPKRVIEAVASAGSFLDGGGSRPMQHAAIDLLSAEHTRAETQAIRDIFVKKRGLMIEGLRALGVHIDSEPEGTFYIWGDVSKLPEPWNTGEGFFRAALQQRVITVPGEFFDVDPGQRRNVRPSRFKNHVRFSFGPEQNVLAAALDRLKSAIKVA